MLAGSPAFQVVGSHQSIQNIDDEILPDKLKGKELKAVSTGKQLEQFIEKQEPAPKPDSLKNKPQVLDLIDEADEEEENDEDLVMEAMIGEYLMEQYASISNPAALGSFIGRNPSVFQSVRVERLMSSQRTDSENRQFRPHQVSEIGTTLL